MSSGPVTIVFGTAALGNYPPFLDQDYIQQVFATLDQYGVKILDSAQVYGESEAMLGKLEAGNKYSIDTKWPGAYVPGSATKDAIIKAAKASLDRLKVKQVDIFYIHTPINEVPLEETLAGVNEVFKAGIFRRFGLSNFGASDVQKVYDTAEANGYVLPTVYQGNYNPVGRGQETKIFPIIRKLNMSFYAYSPLAGGFLTKSVKHVKDGEGRFSKEVINGMYTKLYDKPLLLDALAKWEAIANEEGVSRAELAYRWVASNSYLSREHGDAIIIGASSIDQLVQTITGIKKGKLSPQAMKAIDDMWAEIKDEAPLNNFEAYSPSADSTKIH